MNTPKLGNIITANEERDAVHVAIAPIKAGEILQPGSPIRLVGRKAYFTSDRENSVVCVDPFLAAQVEEGKTFWLLMNPREVIAMKHIWASANLEGTSERDSDADHEAWCSSVGCN